jgi:hypothetical protein
MKGMDILRISYKPKDHQRFSGQNSKSPTQKIPSNMDSRSKSKSRKYIINHDVRNPRRGKEDVFPGQDHRNKELQNLEKLLEERKRRIQTSSK